MIKKIEYEYKEAIQNDSTIAEKNKVTDSNMNEIKDVVNSNADELNSNKGTLSYTEKASEINKKNIDILIENFDKEIAEGTKIDLENTAEAPIEVVEISGNTTQETREGYNELDIEKMGNGSGNGVNFSIEEGRLIFNGTTTSAQYIYNNSKIVAKLNSGNYTFIIKKAGGNANLGSGVLGFYLNENDNQISNITINSSSANTIIGNFSLDGEKEISFKIYANLSGMVFDDFKLELMIVEGTYTAENAPEFEEYGTMPSLEYESEVEGIIGDVNSKISDSIENNQNQLYQFSLGDKVLYGDENARDVFNVTIDQDFYEKTGYRKITNLDLVKKWKKYILDGINNKFLGKAGTTNNNMFVTGIPLNILKAVNNNIIVKSYCNYFNGDFSVNNVFLNNRIGYGISNAGTLQFGFGLESDINTLELANAKLQELNTAGKSLYVVYQLATPETENITDETLIAQIENFINNSYTYKQATSINSDFYLKLNYRKNMYYDLENRISALEQAQIL